MIPFTFMNRLGLILALAFVGSVPLSLASASTGSSSVVRPLVAGVSLETRSMVVPVGERNLFVSCQGTGSPMVLLLAGYGGGISDWPRVQPALATRTTVCSYDRAGIGLSDGHSGTPASADKTSEDLHAVIAAIAGQEKVVLAGFSLGGLFALYHAALHSEQVMAVVLIDPTPPLWPALHLTEHSGRARIQVLELLSGMADNAGERLDVLRIGREVLGAPNLGVPVSILSAGIKSLNPGPYGDSTTRILRKLEGELMRDTLADYSVAPGCTHALPAVCPVEVIDAIENMLESLGRD